MVINPIVGVYIPIKRIPIKGGMSLSPKNATFDHGTCGYSLQIVEKTSEYQQLAPEKWMCGRRDDDRLSFWGKLTVQLRRVPLGVADYDYLDLL